MLATLIYYVPDQMKKQKAIEDILIQFARSGSSNARKTYIEFCVKALPVMSQSFFKQHFLKDLMFLAKDQNDMVRLRFLKKAISVLNDYLGVTDTPFVLELIAIVDKLKNDKMIEISDAAYDVDDDVKFYK